MVPNEDAVAVFEEKILEDIDLIIGVGAGVINDLCKYVSHRHGLPYDTVKSVSDMAEKIVARDEKSIASLMRALVVVGIAMAYMGNSAQLREVSIIFLIISRLLAFCETSPIFVMILMLPIQHT